MALSINRNIVECKGEQQAKEEARKEGINRNIVECKVGTQLSGRASGLVLIETQWNVKVFATFAARSVTRCINRNIVECKEG